MKISFENVFYDYQNNEDKHSLENISFTLGDHFFIGLIGQTGSGKSTLIQQINALLKPTKGIVKVGDYLIDSKNKKIKDVKKIRKYAGLVFQFPEYQLFEENVLKDVMFGPINFGISHDEALKKSKEKLKAVGISEDYYYKSPFELSGGEKRKVAIAGIMAIEPEVLILDEPCAGLDPKSSKEIMELFYDLYKNGTSIIMVSHNMDTVLKYCTDCLVLHDGKLLGKYKTTELFYNNEVLHEAGILKPHIIPYIKKAVEKGFNIDKDKIRDIDSFIKELEVNKKC